MPAWGYRSFDLPGFSDSAGALPALYHMGAG
jgi:hypothetical protein